MSVSLLYGQLNPQLKNLGAYKAYYAIGDSVVVNQVNRIALDSAYTNAEKSQKFLWKSIEISKKIEYPYGNVEAYLALSSTKVYLNEIDSAMYYANEAVELANKMNDKILMARARGRKAGTYYSKGKYDKASEEYFESIKIAEQVHERFAIGSYLGIGQVYRKTGNKEKAEEYALRSLRLAEKYKDTSAMMSANNLMGIISKNNKKIDEALSYYEDGLKLARESKNDKFLSQILYNMSNIYFRQKKDYDKGFELFNESIDISRNNGNFRSIAVGFHALANTYYDLKEYEKALSAADTALYYAEKNNNLDLIIESYATLAQISYSMGEKDDGFNYLAYAYIYKDSLNLSKINNAIADSESQYEYEKKELKAQMARDQQKRINEEKLWWRDLLLWISGIVLVIVCVGIYMLFKSNKQITLKNVTVERQKEEISNQHQEIRDSIEYAKRIQSALIGNAREWRKLSEEIAIYFNPRDVVSGDFYWVYTNMESNLSIWAVGDCTGHGVPGAFMSMLGVGLLNDIVIDNGTTDPGEILDTLRTKIIASLETEQEDSSNDGMDMGICVWNRNTNELSFAGANNGLWLIRESSKLDEKIFKSILKDENSDLALAELAPDKMPIGHYFKVPPPFNTKKIKLEDGDNIILYTDGYADQFGGPDDKKFKYKQLKELLLDLSSKPFSLHEAELGRVFDEWMGENSQTDDVCLVSMKVRFG